MLWRTHFIAGAGLGTAYGAVFFPNEPMIMAVATGIGGLAALLPDIDSPHSRLGRIVRPVSDVLNFALGHRGFLHSLWGMAFLVAIAVFTATFWVESALVWCFVLPVAVLGYLSHLFLDALTPGGVPLLWPRRGNVSLPLVRTGSLLERLLFLPALAAVAVVVLSGVIR